MKLMDSYFLYLDNCSNFNFTVWNSIILDLRAHRYIFMCLCIFECELSYFLLSFPQMSLRISFGKRLVAVALTFIRIEHMFFALNENWTLATWTQNICTALHKIHIDMSDCTRIVHTHTQIYIFIFLCICAYVKWRHYMCVNICQLLSAFVCLVAKGLKERGFVQINELQHLVCRSAAKSARCYA